MMTLYRNGDYNSAYLGTAEHYYTCVAYIRIQPFVDGSGWVVTAWDTVDYDPDFPTGLGDFYIHKPSVAEVMAHYAADAILMKWEEKC
jgi:hypothetical protein